MAIWPWVGGLVFCLTALFRTNITQEPGILLIRCLFLNSLMLLPIQLKQFSAMQLFSPVLLLL
jgi:hypothetical protein